MLNFEVSIVSFMIERKSTSKKYELIVRLLFTRILLSFTSYTVTANPDA